MKPKAKNGETLPPAPLPRAQRTPQTPSKKPEDGSEREEAERKALLAVQCSLLKILSKTLATLQHFTPDCCQILLDQVSHCASCRREPPPPKPAKTKQPCASVLSWMQSMDLAEYRTLFVLSFTTPAFDPEVAPSFGTLLATINVALSMLGEVDESGKSCTLMLWAQLYVDPSLFCVWFFFFFQIEKKKEPAALSLATLTSSEEIQALK